MPWRALGERVDRVRKLTVFGALAGAFLILGGPSVLAQPPNLADALAVLSGLALALNNVLCRKLSRVGLADKVAGMFAGCLFWSVPLTLFGVQPLPSGVPVNVWLELVRGLVWIFVATVGTQWESRTVADARLC